MKKLIVVIAVIIACVLLAPSIHQEDNNEVPQGKGFELDNEFDLIKGNIIDDAQNDKQNKENLKSLHYKEKDFMSSVSNISEKNIEGSSIRGGVISHHLLADRIIASFFKTVSSENPDLEVVVIVAPNHNRIGNKKINTGLWNWETPFGILETETSIVNQILSEFDAGTGFKLLQEDHSISALVPYVKYFLPSAKIVPILLHGNLGIEDSTLLGEKLGSIVHDKEYVVIGSIDFSHYLSVEKADKMDKITIEAIKDRDLSALSHMNNDHLDSPPSIITLLSAMEKAEASNMTVLDHSNSARIAGVESDNTTSYFSIIFSTE